MDTPNETDTTWLNLELGEKQYPNYKDKYNIVGTDDRK